MCGLVAYQAGEVSRQSLKQSMRTLTHRGPDEEGIFTDQTHQVGLGHRRLSIIDVESGQQPMSKNEITVIYNGEIYNYRELKAELNSRGYTFSTKSDTEVLLQAYREWDKKCLEKFRGMFSFVLWDRNKNRLFMARDRMGQKPLFYANTEKGFFVGSEIQSLLEFDQISPTLNRRAIPTYLRLKYIPSPQSGFKQINKVQPGHYMMVQDNEIIENKRYWNLLDAYRTRRDLSFNEAINGVRTHLRESTKLRMRSDVPFGAFLSGGIDSSITVALMAELSDQPVKTFSVGFDYEEFNELPYARMVAQRYSTDHRDFEVAPDIESLLPSLAQHYGEPYADSSAVPTYYVSRETGKHVTVALTGDGGDEAFGGYNRYRGMLFHQVLEEYLPTTLLKIIPAFTNRLPCPDDRGHFLNRIRRFARGLGASPAERNLSLVNFFTEDQARQILNDGSEADMAYQYFEEFFRAVAFIDSDSEKMMAVDQMSYLPECLLTKVDIASMMSSVECRSPFLDHEVIEFAASLPVKYKVNWNDKKRILKEAFRNDLPEDILDRGKQGFSIPMVEWLRDELKDFVRDCLLSTDELFFEIFDRSTVRKLLNRHQQREADYSQQLWALMMFRLWMNAFNVR
ncbi:MAG: asparagine synthase (glutamine-hydrolyzing) [bacterium]